MTSRDYCFTSFKLSVYDKLSNMDTSNVKYCVAQLETAPETGKQHVQGFIVLKNPQRISWLKNLLEDPALHVEKRKGTPQQVSACCAVLRAETVLRRAELSRQNLKFEFSRVSRICAQCKPFINPYDDK